MRYISDGSDRGDGQRSGEGSVTRRVREDAPGYLTHASLEAPLANGAGGILQLLLRRRLTALAFCIAGAAAGYATSLFQTPIYSSRTLIEVQNVNYDYLSIRDVDPHSSNLPDDYSYIPTQLGILQSETLIDRVRRKLGSDQAGKPEYQKALDLAAATVRARSPNQTRLIEIYADSTNPQAAAAFANTLAEEYIQQDLDMRQKDSGRTRDLLNEQSRELKMNLQSSEAQLQAYTRQSGLLVIAEKSSVAENKLQQLQGQLSEAHADQVLKRSKFETARRATSAAGAARLDDGQSRELRAKLTELRRQLAEQSVLLAPGHYKIQRLQAEIGELESAVGRERTDNLERLQNDYETAVQRESLLSEAAADQVKVVSDLAVKAIHYNILKDEITAGRQLYESMLQKLKEASIAAVVRPRNARLLDSARPAALPYKPDRKVNLGLGLLAGLLMGSFWISMRERWNGNLRSPAEARELLNLVELGTIPTTRPTDRPEAAAVFAESFRSVLTSILMAERAGTRSKVLVVTSPGAAEGKTLTVASLGSALAESQRRVLLIDADVRKPQLHMRFGIRRVPGLGDMLLSQQPVTAELVDATVRKTSTPGVHVLPAGSFDPALSTWFYSPRMKQILDICRGAFDYVLIDAPPVLLFSDARALGRQSDAVILIFRANQTSRDAAQIAGQRLTEDSTRILGIILNDWTTRNAVYSRYYNSKATAGTSS